jgi:hypothetical protein
MNKCRECQQYKAPDKFGWRNKGAPAVGRKHICRDCESAYLRQYRRAKRARTYKKRATIPAYIPPVEDIDINTNDNQL